MFKWIRCKTRHRVILLPNDGPPVTIMTAMSLWEAKDYINKHQDDFEENEKMMIERVCLWEKVDAN